MFCGGDVYFVPASPLHWFEAGSETAGTRNALRVNMSIYISFMLRNMDASQNRTASPDALVAGQALGRLAATELANGPLQANVAERVAAAVAQGESVKRSRPTGVAMTVE
jgi:hypothetical protein